MADVLLALGVLARLENAPAIRADYKNSESDVNGDRQIGMEEVIYLRRHLSGMKFPNSPGP